MSALDATLRTALAEHGYRHVRQLADGRVIGVSPQMFTFGLFYGLDETGYAGRYCYEHAQDVIAAVAAWDGNGDPPGPWIKHKGHGGDELGPGAVK